MSEDALLARIRRLEDLEDIRRLKHTYCALCDANYDADGLAALFAEDAVWDGGPMGVHRGREAIRRFFQGSSKRVPFALHMVTNPILDVDGDRATGRWYLWQPMVYRLPGGDQAWWMSARYDDEYVREGAHWRFARVTVNLRLLAPYEAGWGPSQIVDVYGSLRATLPSGDMS
jgi:ketosteroid isomerase-like protein